MVGFIIVKYKGQYGTISQLWDCLNKDDQQPIVSIVLSHSILCYAISVYRFATSYCGVPSGGAKC